MDVMEQTLIDIHLINLGTGEKNIITTLLEYTHDGFWDYVDYAEGPCACDCVRSNMLYEKNPLYELPCNHGLNTILIEMGDTTEILKYRRAL